MSTSARPPAAMVTTAVLVGALIPLGGAAAIASASTSAPLSVELRRGPILIKTFWSVILRMVITISKHAGSRMASRGVTEATLKRVLNDGKVVSRTNGVTRIRWGAFEARVNSRTGNVITVVRVSAGGGGR